MNRKMLCNVWKWLRTYLEYNKEKIEMSNDLRISSSYYNIKWYLVAFGYLKQLDLEISLLKTYLNIEKMNPCSINSVEKRQFQMPGKFGMW